MTPTTSTDAKDALSAVTGSISKSLLLPPFAFPMISQVFSCQDLERATSCTGHSQLQERATVAGIVHVTSSSYLAQSESKSRSMLWVTG